MRLNKSREENLRRRIRFLVAGSILLVLPVLSQTIREDASTFLGTEWQEYPQHCLEAPRFEVAEGNHAEAFRELKKDQSTHVQQVYDQAFSQ